MKLHVTVATRHIIEGTPGDGTSCPIHLAMEELGIRRQFTVERLRVTFYEGYREAHHSYLPSQATAFIDLFDAVAEVQPFEFDLEVPDWVMEEEKK
jgi:hypothetical protein